ncbi:MAG: hypothetical protein U0359_19070 [Byssovorax sp.]
MRLRSPAHLPLLLASALLASACNLIFGIQEGEPLGTGGSGTGGSTTTTTTGTGGTGVTTGTGGTGGSTTSTGGGGSGGTGGGATCAASTATCQGNVLHACDEVGHPLAPETCDSVAACDPIARACIPFDSAPRLGVGTGRVCAIEDDRTLRCWGLNEGRLIPGDPHIALHTAVALPGLTSVRQVSVGTGHACALQDDGSVICWGSNDSGETGVPPGGSYEPAKVTMPGSKPALEIGASHRCSCARLNDGTVACWGQESTGCFGKPMPMDNVIFTPALVPGIDDAVQLSVNAYETPTCARRASGKVTCWSMDTTPKDIDGIDDATDVHVGRGTIFIRSKTKGLVWTTPMGSDFAPVTPYGILGTITAFGGGDNFCAVRDDGSVLLAVLGSPPPDIPGPVGNLPQGKIVELGVGYGLSYGRGLQCIRLAGAPLASHVYCWGDDLAGALGANSPGDFRAPQVVPGITTAASLSTSQVTTSVVLANGAVTYWGLGNTLDGIGSKTPTMVNTAGNDNARVTINDSGGYAYIVKKTGALTYLNGGQFMPGERLLKSNQADYAQVFAYYHFDFGLRTNGTLMTYSDDDTANQSGVLGDGTMSAIAGHTQPVPGLSSVQSVSVYGDDYSAEPTRLRHPRPEQLARLLGRQRLRRDRHRRAERSGPSPTPVTIPNGESIVSVAAGRIFTCAVSSVGSVYCWGSNDYGELGATRPSSTSEPEPRPGHHQRQGGERARRSMPARCSRTRPWSAGASTSTASSATAPSRTATPRPR